MTYETKMTYPMHGGVKFETCVTLGDAPADSMHDKPGKRVLVLATLKRHDGLIAHASVCVERDEGSYTTRTSAVFEDYSRTLYKAPQGTRATEKNLRALHNQALEVLPDVQHACMARYYPETVVA